MSTYRVTAIQWVYHEIIVEAESDEEAIQKAQDSEDGWNIMEYETMFHGGWNDYEAEQINHEKEKVT